MEITRAIASACSYLLYPQMAVYFESDSCLIISTSSSARTARMEESIERAISGGMIIDDITID